MKKAYTITPAQRQENIKIMSNARYHYGSLANAPEEVKARCRKAAEENATITELPKDDLFLENEVMYNLFLNRDTDEPITARELYIIVRTIKEAIDEAERSAKLASANWD